MDTELIIIKKIYQNSRIDPEFLSLLNEEGLIEMIDIGGEKYIQESKLTDLEKFASWYYDLSVNVEGIDVINNMLQKMHQMEKELYTLRKRINDEIDNWDDINF